MKNSILVLLVFSIFVVACSNERETASGQKFTVIRKGDGKEIDGKQIVVLNYLLKDSKDSVWNESKTTGVPLIQQKKALMTSPDKVFEVVNMLTKGDSVMFKISAYELFTKLSHSALPPKVDSASLFTFLFGMQEVLDSAEFMKYREDMTARQNEKMRKEQEAQLGKDTMIIDNYLKEKNILAMKTKSGLRFIKSIQGMGSTAKEGQTAKVFYAGYLMNGKYFDTNIESTAKAQNMFRQGGAYKAIEVPLGRNAVIPGWEEALKLMRKGDKMTVYIPSTLAYGSRAAGRDITPNSILIFEMEMVDLK